jgi:hypothetical protein
MTEQENMYIQDWHRCPDCGARLYEGPEGGGSINLICKTCGSKFNWGWFGERINEPLVLVAYNKC